MHWHWTIGTGILGGLLYVATTWAGTLTGLLEWYQQWNPDQLLEMVSILTPFSLFALFLLGSMVVHRRLRPQDQYAHPNHRLWLIGLGFSLGATFSQLILMRLEGVVATRAWLVTGVFLGSSLLLTLLVIQFYRFLTQRTPPSP